MDIAVINLYNKDLRNIPDYGIFSIIKTVTSDCLYLAACDKLNEMLLKIVQSFYEYLLKICQINYHLKERIEIAWCTSFPKLRSSLFLLSFS